IAFPDESEIMLVSLSAGAPEGLDQIVNAVVQTFFNEVVNAERNRKLDRVNSLDLAYKKAEVELRSKRSDLRQLVERLGSSDSSTLTLVQQNSLQQFAAYNSKFVQVRFELLQAQNEQAAAQAAKEGDIAPISEGELAAALRTDRRSVELLATKH